MKKYLRFTRYSEYGYFWFSKKQRTISGSTKNFAYIFRLDKVVEYTEWSRTRRNLSDFSDIEYLGFGYYSHSKHTSDFYNDISKYTIPEMIYWW